MATKKKRKIVPFRIKSRISSPTNSKNWYFRNPSNAHQDVVSPEKTDVDKSPDKAQIRYSFIHIRRGYKSAKSVAPSFNSIDR
jgi:hypothetical protein